MNSNMSAGIAILIFIAAMPDTHFAAEEEVEWGKEVGGCRLAIAPLQPSFRYDQPVQLRLTIKNFSDEAVLMVGGNSMVTYGYQVRLPNGEPAPLTLEGKRQAALTGIRLTKEKLEAGKSDTFPVMLNRLYDMTLRGEYTVTVYRQVGMRRTDDSTRLKWVKVPSNMLKIVVHDNPEEKPAEE